MRSTASGFSEPPHLRDHASNIAQAYFVPKARSDSVSSLVLFPPPCCRRFSRDFRTLLRRQRCRPRFASDFTAFLGDCRPSRRRELLGTGLATLRGNGLHVLLKGDRSRRSLLSRHDSTAYHATARKV